MLLQRRRERADASCSELKSTSLIKAELIVGFNNLTQKRYTFPEKLDWFTSEGNNFQSNTRMLVPKQMRKNFLGCVYIERKAT